MKTKVENISSTTRLLHIEVSSDELNQKFDQVYKDIAKVAHIPGYRPGRAPQDLLRNRYAERAKEEVIKRAIPEYYLKAVREENLVPVAAPEITEPQFKNYTLYFKARIDVKPRIKLKSYKNLKIIKKKHKIEPNQVDQVLDRLRRSRAKYVEDAEKKEKKEVLPQLDDTFAKDLGFANLDNLKDAVNRDLQMHADVEVNTDMERQIMEHLLRRAALDAPDSLVKRQKQQLLNQMKTNHLLRGGKKEEVESKTKVLEEEAEKEAIRRVKLSFILEEIGREENVQVNEEDLQKRIEEISQKSGRSIAEVKRYLETQNLISSIKAELRDRKTIQFLLKEASVVEEK